jgi:hypothetical protein
MAHYRSCNPFIHTNWNFSVCPSLKSSTYLLSPVYICQIHSHKWENVLSPIVSGKTHNEFPIHKRNAFGHEWCKGSSFRSYESVRQKAFYFFLNLRCHNSPTRTFATEWISPSLNIFSTCLSSFECCFLISLCTLLQQLFLLLSSSIPWGLLLQNWRTFL